jgi:AhpD family alkylhydroperoxidase
MTQASRMNFYHYAPQAFKAMLNLSNAVKEGAIGTQLAELVFLRVSQINGCGVCIDMHWRALVKGGADPRHLNTLSAWRESPFFSDRERAALNWAEAVNAIPHREPSDADFAQLQEHFTENEIAELGYAVAVIRGWNMFNVSLRNPIPVTPPPGM